MAGRNFVNTKSLYQNRERERKLISLSQTVVSRSMWSTDTYIHRNPFESFIFISFILMRLWCDSDVILHAVSPLDFLENVLEYLKSNAEKIRPLPEVEYWRSRENHLGCRSEPTGQFAWRSVQVLLLHALRSICWRHPKQNIRRRDPY